jgi:hypothetical protein
MKVFQGFNQAGAACPVCGTKDDKPTVLVPTPGTEVGDRMVAKQVHEDCAVIVLQLALFPPYMRMQPTGTAEAAAQNAARLARLRESGVLGKSFGFEYDDEVVVVSHTPDKASE